MGIQYTTEGIVVSDNAGSSVIDGSGLVSVTSFNYGQGTASPGTQTITGDGTANYVDITGGSVTVVASRTTALMISAYVQGEHVDADGSLMIRIVDNSTQVGPVWSIRGTVFQNAAISYIGSVSAGTHAIHLEATQNNELGTAYIKSSSISTGAFINYVTLGK